MSQKSLLRLEHQTWGRCPSTHPKWYNFTVYTCFHITVVFLRYSFFAETCHRPFCKMSLQRNIPPLLYTLARSRVLSNSVKEKHKKQELLKNCRCACSTFEKHSFGPSIIYPPRCAWKTKCNQGVTSICLCSSPVVLWRDARGSCERKPLGPWNLNLIYWEQHR